MITLKIVQGIRAGKIFDILDEKKIEYWKTWICACVGYVNEQNKGKYINMHKTYKYSL